MKIGKATLLFLFILAVHFAFAQPDTTAPIVDFLMPGNAAYFSCNSGNIIMLIRDESPLDLLSSFLTATIHGSPFVLPDSTSSPMDSIYYFALPPETELWDGDSVWLSYAPICDMLHNCRDTTFFFFVDLSPPNVWLISPLEGALPAPVLNFVAYAEDNLSGISADSSTISVYVWGTNFWNTSLHFSSSFITFIGCTLRIAIETLGPLAGGDSIFLCVSAADNAVGCDANRTDTCFAYYLPLTPPIIDISYPFDGAIVGDDCADSVVFRITDDDSIINIVVIIGTDTFELGDSELAFDGTLAVLNTDGVFSSGEFATIEIYCEDVYHTISAETLGIWIDSDAPYVFDIAPECSTLIVDTVETVDVWLMDNLAGVDPATVSLTVDGVPIPFDYDSISDRLSFEYIFHGYADTSDSVYLMICITARDRPDICNSPLDTCFMYMLYINTSIPVVTPPNEIVTACEGQDIIISAFSTGGLDSEYISLELNSLPFGPIDFLDLTDPLFRMESYSVPPFGVEDSLFFTPDLGYWNDADTIMCTFQFRYIGSTDNDLRTWLFYTDFSPPYFFPVNPPDMSIAVSTPETLLFILGDMVSGIWEPDFACTIYVNGVENVVPFSSLVDVGVDNFFIALNEIGISLSPCDSVKIVIHIPDRVSEEFCGPNVLHTSWSFSLDCSAPTAHLVEPDFGAILSCSLQTVSFYIENDANLDSSTIMLLIGDDSIYYGDARLYFAHPCTLTFAPSVPWTNGDTVSGELAPIYDYVGNHSDAVPFQFVIDVSAPEIIPITPLPAALITDSLAPIQIIIRDVISGLAGYGIAADFGIDFTSTSHDTFIFEPAVAGAVLGPEDTICVMVWAADDAQMCGANSDTIDYCFLVDALGPRITDIDSVIGVFTSCDDRSTTFTFTDFLGLNQYFVRVYSSHEGETLSYDSPQLYVHDTVIIYSPGSPYSDGESVRLEVISAPDIAGNDFLAESLTVTFTVDLSAPVIEFTAPAPGETLGTTIPVDTFIVHDAFAGVNWTSCSIYVSINTSWDTVLLYSSPAINISADTLFVVLRDAGIVLSGNDSVTICLSVSDAIFDTSFGCFANIADTCIYFMIDASPPVIAPVRPGDGAITSCPEQIVAFAITDSEGVDWDTVVFVVCEDTFSLGDDALEHISGTDTVTYNPTLGTEFCSDTVNVCVIYARDTLGNELESPVCWTFYIDTIPPTIINLYPTSGMHTTDTNPLMSATYYDYITEIVIVDSFAIDGIWHPADDAFWTSDSFAYIISDSLGDGEHTICLALQDQPFISCGNNVLISCWNFWIDTTPPELSILPDTIPVVACDSFTFTFSASDVDSTILINMWSDAFYAGTVWATDSTAIAGNVVVYAPASDGTVMVRIVVSDSLGNSTADSAYTFFDRTPPEVSFLSPDDAETIFTRQPWVVISAIDESGDVEPSSAYLTVPGRTILYSDGELDWNGFDQFAVDLSAIGVLLPERQWSTIVIGGVSDAVDSLYGCGPNVATQESIRVFVADDDTLPPEFSALDIEWGWCGSSVQPSLNITDDLSGVAEGYALIDVDTFFADADTVSLTPVAGDLWTIDTAIILSNDTIWIRICAADADSESGWGYDTLWGCSQPFPILCQKPFIVIIDDTIDFGEMCINEIANDSFAVTNPTGVNVELAIYPIDSLCFNISDSLFTIASGETLFIVVQFSPVDERSYFLNLDILLDEALAGSVVLLGSGKLCPSGFSAEPRIITPNSDGAYDKTTFTFPLRTDNEVKIYAKNLFEIRTLKTNTIQTVWDGTDNLGRDCPPGPYLFIAFEDGELIGKGIIVIAR